MKNNLSKYLFDTSYSDKTKVQQFYSNILKVAKVYKRVSAYFSTGIFNYLSKGIDEFINNEGYMQLILSPEINSEVVDEINKGYKLKIFDYKKFDKLSDTVESICRQENISLFAYLIAIGKLDIKIVLKKQGILHHKFGCVTDGVNNLLFVGSNNTTVNAMKNNDESFQVTIDWDSPSKRELQAIDEFNKLFDDYWNNNFNDSITFELPDEYITQLINDINYDEVKKRIKKNTNFVRFDLNENYDIEITSNVNLKEIYSNNSLSFYKTFVSYNDENKIQFSGLNNSQDIFELSKYLKKIVDKMDISFYYTHRANKFFESRIRDYALMAKIGNEIKDDDYLRSDSFSFIKDKINSIVKRPLVDQQIVTCSHIIELERSLNFSVPGSGKTATILGAFEYLNSLPYVDNRYVNKLIVFGPINCIKSWKDEYEFVSYKSDEHAPLDITNCNNRNDKLSVLLHDFKTSRIILINYEMIPFLESILKELINNKSFVVFDEIHRIKNIKSPKYASLNNIIKDVRYRVALTGTPLPNGYIDLYNIISLLHDDYTEKYFGMYKSSLSKYDSDFKKVGIQNTDLNKRLYPFYIRITKKDLNIPNPEPDHLVYIYANKNEIELFDKIKKTNSSSFDRIIKQVQIGCIPHKIDDSLSLNFDINQGNYHEYMTSKLYSFLRNILNNKRKSVVWCIYVETIKIVSKILEYNGFKVKVIYGETSQIERDKIINQFNYSNNVDIIVTNPATLAESVSLHKSCHDAHYLELDYNLYQYLQSRDRIHRLGLKPYDKTNYYIYVNVYGELNTNSIDLKIYETLNKKRDRMISSIENGEFVFDIDKELDYKLLDYEVND